MALISAYSRPDPSGFLGDSRDLAKISRNSWGMLGIWLRSLGIPTTLVKINLKNGGHAPSMSARPSMSIRRPFNVGARAKVV